MSRGEYRLGEQSGSAGRHFVVLLAIVFLCYFGVKAFYSRIDSTVDGQRDQAQQGPSGEAVEMVQSGDLLSQIDKEAITRRNLFLPSSGQQRRGISNDSMNSRGAAEADLLLVGTIIETGGLNRAVILDVEERKQVLLSEGDTINGVIIRQISSGKVIISRQGQNELLDIAEAAKIRASIMGLAAGSPALSNLGTAPSLPDNSLQEADKSEDDTLRVDLNKLKSTDQRVIIKGRLSEDI